MTTDDDIRAADLGSNPGRCEFCANQPCICEEGGEEQDNASGTLADAKKHLQTLGLTLKHDAGTGEYIVNFKGGKEATAYFTDDLDDAVKTGEKMAQENPTGDTDDQTPEDLKAEMVEVIKGGLGNSVEVDDFDIESAIYWFAGDYYEGQNDPMYGVLSLSEFKPGPSHRSVDDEGEMAVMMYEILEDEYAEASGPDEGIDDDRGHPSGQDEE